MAEQENAKEQKSSEWMPIALSAVCVLLIACNVALTMRFRQEQKARLLLEKQKTEQQKFMTHMALSEQTRWQAEIRYLLHDVETALEAWKAEDYQQVIEKLDLEKNDYSSFPFAYYIRGSSLEQLQRDEEVLLDFKIYLEQRYFSDHARYKKARILYKNKRTEEAKTELQKVIDHRPDFEPAKKLLEKIEKPQ